jgi:oligopeptide transport system permease protein
MTDLAALEPVPPREAEGRSLWSDAWARLKTNRAAVWSAVFLAMMVLACVLGPAFTGHSFSTIYPEYVRVPPSISPYPKPDQIEPALAEAMKRARVEIVRWERTPEGISVTVRASKPVDPRVTRYLDRSSVFDGAEVTGTAEEGRELTIAARVKPLYFLFGTDSTGRDLLTRTLVAGQVSLAVGLLGGLVSVLIGVAYGATSGLIGGRTDEFMMRLVDVLYSLPFIFFVIMLVVFFGRNFLLMFLGIAAVLWLDMARIVRGQTLSLKRQEFVQAAEALGVGSAGILIRHIVPNLLGPVVIYLTLLVPQVIILESFLSYFGLGVQEPMSSWGVLISQGKNNIPAANWLLIFPSLFLTSTLFALNFLGDGLRDALDPRDR